MTLQGIFNEEYYPIPIKWGKEMGLEYEIIDNANLPVDPEFLARDKARQEEQTRVREEQYKKINGNDKVLFKAMPVPKPTIDDEKKARQKEYMRRWREKNREHIIEYRREYYKTNADERRAAARRRNEKQKDNVKARRKRYYEKHKEEIIEKVKKYYAERYKEMKNQRKSMKNNDAEDRA